jgi:hypothetical protein
MGLSRPVMGQLYIRIKRTNSWRTRSESLIVVTMRITVYWDVSQFSQSVLEEPAASYITPSTLRMDEADSFKTFVIGYRLHGSATQQTVIFNSTCLVL